MPSIFQALINYWNENKGIADKNGDNILQLVILQGEIGQQDVILRTEAYEETLTEQGIDYEIIAIDTANWDKAQALDKMNAWITAFGIDGVERSTRLHYVAFCRHSGSCRPVSALPPTLQYGTLQKTGKTPLPFIVYARAAHGTRKQDQNSDQRREQA